jgi:hypothetical protein
MEPQTPTGTSDVRGQWKRYLKVDGFSLKIHCCHEG